ISAGPRPKPPDVKQPDGYRAASEEMPDDSWKTMGGARRNTATLFAFVDNAAARSFQTPPHRQKAAVSNGFGNVRFGALCTRAHRHRIPISRKAQVARHISSAASLSGANCAGHPGRD